MAPLAVKWPTSGFVVVEYSVCARRQDCCCLRHLYLTNSTIWPYRLLRRRRNKTEEVERRWKGDGTRVVFPFMPFSKKNSLTSLGIAFWLQMESEKGQRDRSQFIEGGADIVGGNDTHR